jgi:hypothetical protein
VTCARGRWRSCSSHHTSSDSKLHPDEIHEHDDTGTVEHCTDASVATYSTRLDHSCRSASTATGLRDASRCGRSRAGLSIAPCETPGEPGVAAAGEHDGVRGRASSPRKRDRDDERDRSRRHRFQSWGVSDPRSRSRCLRQQLTVRGPWRVRSTGEGTRQSSRPPCGRR